jgi:HSP20 family protein
MGKEDFDKMKDQIHRLMGGFFKDVKPLAYQADQAFHPPMDIYETEEHLVVVLEIAGMNPEEFRVLFEKDLLSVRGRRTEICSQRKTHLHQMEIDYGLFERTLQIPFPLKTEEFKATYQQGFLVITVPKAKAAISHTVEVKIR